MVDRQSIYNDLNAIANAISREENLDGIAGEIAIVLENMDELAQKEAKDAEKPKAVDAHPESDADSCPAS